MVKTVGIIGFGSFGSFLAQNLAVRYCVSVSDVQDHQVNAEMMGVEWECLEQVAAKEIVILAVPLQDMESVLERIVSCVSLEALVMDVCSVKQSPVQLMRKYLPTVDILGTHPLFGPQSAAKGWGGHKLVVCQNNGLQSRKIKTILEFFQSQGVVLIEMTAEQHDREMAMVQGLTHFIARGLKKCGIQDSELATTAFEHLHKVTELLGQDSWELFRTIENGNPFAAEARRQFVAKLQELEVRLAE